MLQSDRRFFLGVSVFVLTLITLPVILAYRGAGPDYVFGGVLLNPFDGWTYFAKAYQGWAGNWRMVLPFTAEPGDGAYINLYYVFLGHLARILRAPISIVLNAARVINMALLLLALWRFFVAQFSERPARRIAFLIASLALGMGWLLLFRGDIPADFWVAEAYPFLSGLTNAHFPLGLAIILVLATPVNRPGFKLFLLDVVLGLLLALVSPFAVIIALLPWAGLLFLEGFRIFRDQEASIKDVLRYPGLYRLLAVIVGGMPVVVYDLAAIYSDPIMSAWNSQNITITPAWWDLLFSFSPTLILALVGFRKAPRMLLVWSALGLFLIVFPHPLQRRFLMGIQIPLAGLAAAGWVRLPKNKQRLARIAVFLCFLPSPILLLFSIQTGITGHNPLLYLRQTEASAFDWIVNNTDHEDLVLASPEVGLFIPGLTGRRVIYGHPFETINAEVEKAGVEAFFGGENSSANIQYLEEREVDFVFFGERERALGNFMPGSDLELVYENEEVRIYQVQH